MFTILDRQTRKTYGAFATEREALDAKRDGSIFGDDDRAEKVVCLSPAGYKSRKYIIATGGVAR